VAGLNIKVDFTNLATMGVGLDANIGANSKTNYKGKIIKSIVKIAPGTAQSIGLRDLQGENILNVWIGT